MALALAVAIGGILVAPHLLSQDRLPTISGIVLWLAVLSLRAAISILLVMLAVTYLPSTELFRAITHWCLHAVLPLVATHLGFDGHALGDAAVLVPALGLVASLLSVSYGIWRGARAIGEWLRGSSLGVGPRDSLIVGGEDVVVAAAGVRRPRVVVSAGALMRLDDEELAAGVEHEHGHIARGHRLLLLAGELLLSASRLVPGGTHALRGLRFQLERDADEYALRRTGDPAALAAAICKAAVPAAGAAPACVASGLAGSGTPERLSLLTGPPRRSRLATTAARLIALCAIAATLAIAVAGPAVATPASDPALDDAHAQLADCE